MKNIKKHDYISSFSEYVKGKIRNLADTRLQALAQMRFQTVLFEIEMGQSILPRTKYSHASQYPEPPLYVDYVSPTHIQNSVTPSPSVYHNICTPNT
jgi:hypothetical protein